MIAEWFRQKKARKKKVDILIPLLKELLRVGNRGLVLNADFANRNKWTPSGLCYTVKQLRNRDMLICSDGAGTHNKQCTLKQNLLDIELCLLAYFGGNVPPKYMYLIDSTVRAPKVQTPPTPAPAPTPQSLAQSATDIVRKLEEDKAAVERRNVELEKRVRILEEKLNSIHGLSKIN